MRVAQPTRNSQIPMSSRPERGLHVDRDVRRDRGRRRAGDHRPDPGVGICGSCRRHGRGPLGPRRGHPCSTCHRRMTACEGIDAYRETWPPFFGRLRSGASFDIVELDVTAGSDVAYAWALLRCGTEDEFSERSEQPIAPEHRTASGRRTLGRVPRASFIPRQELAALPALRAGPHSTGGEHR